MIAVLAEDVVIWDVWQTNNLMNVLLLCGVMSGVFMTKEMYLKF